jgi:hemoglobin-like flavoprotein
MRKQLKEKLWASICSDHPDLMFALQQKRRVDSYLDQQVSSILSTAEKLTQNGLSQSAVLDICSKQLILDLGPSRYEYIVSVLSQEFESIYAGLKDSGLLIIEAVNLVRYCKPTFRSLGFSADTEDDKQMYLAITGMISEYFEHQ